MAHPESSEAENFSARYVFRSKEQQIALEPWDGDLPILEDGLLTLMMKPGVTLEEERALAALLNKCVEDVQHVRFLKKK